MSLLYKGGKIGMTARVVLNGSGIVIFPVTILDAKQFREKNVEAPVRPIQNVPTFTIPMTTVTVT
jgi:ribosomal protein L3